MRGRFVARRLVLLLASLLVASFVIFAALYLAPGTPLAALSGGQPLPPGSAQVLEQRYHLNESFLAQYWYWLDNVLHGNVGVSITLRENVSTLIASRIWTTAGLVLYASLIIVVLGIGLGIVSGLRSGPLDTSVLVVTAVSAAIPAFVAAIALIVVFAVKLGWFPALGNGTSFLSNVRHSPLPDIALAAASLAIVARVTRAAVRAEGDREHVQIAVSRGIPARYVIQRHILRNAAIPITAVTGITTASLIAVAAVVEVAFSLNGLGAYWCSRGVQGHRGRAGDLAAAGYRVRRGQSAGRSDLRRARPAAGAQGIAPGEHGHGGRRGLRLPAGPGPAARHRPGQNRRGGRHRGRDVRGRVRPVARPVRPRPAEPVAVLGRPSRRPSARV